MSIESDMYALRDYDPATVVTSRFGDIVIVAAHADDKRRYDAHELDMDGDEPGYIRLWLKDSPEDGEGREVEAYLTPDEAREVIAALEKLLP